MKKLIIPCLAMLALFLMAACSTKFNVAAPYKNITVIYGLLDERDNVHYVRIEKAFLNPNTSALTTAQIADSSFYPLLDVRIKRFDFSGNLIDTIHLSKVDLDTVAGYQKEPGVFFTTPNYAYQFSNTLNPNYNYQIMVTNPASGETDSALAPIIDDENINSGTFTVTLLDNSTAALAGIDFASTLSSRSVKFNATYTAPASFNFEGQQIPAVIAQCILRFHWNDSVTGQPQVADSFDMNLGYQSLSGNYISYDVDDLSFYSAIASGMGPAPAGTYRLIDRVGLFIYTSTQDYSNYYQNSLTQGVGLTGNEIEPVLTNINGANALGLFTSRGYRNGPVTISPNTVDSLEASPYTASVKIAGTVYH